MAGQRQKPREELAFRRGGRDTRVQEAPAGESVVGMAPPTWLELGEEAKATWEMIVPTLQHVRQSEFPLLVRWIIWVQAYWIASKEVMDSTKPGLVERTAFGTKLSAAFRAMERADMNAQRIEAKFGLDPQARMRLGLQSIAQETALQRLRATPARKPPPRVR